MPRLPAVDVPLTTPLELVRVCLRVHPQVRFNVKEVAALTGLEWAVVAEALNQLVTAGAVRRLLGRGPRLGFSYRWIA